jgi:hypothetical protein
MIALWPSDSDPEWLIACNEQGDTEVGLVRIRIADGATATIVQSGLDGCDPVHRTAWGTVVFGEEAGSAGRLFELIDPLDTTNVIVNTDGTTTDGVGGTGAGNIVWRSALGKLSFEASASTPMGSSTTATNSGRAMALLAAPTSNSSRPRLASQAPV